MEVTILSNSRGGVLNFTQQLAHRLVLRGHNVHIFFLIRPRQTKQINASGQLRISYLLTSHFVPNLRTLAYLFFWDRPDVLHINFATFGPLALFKKRVFKICFVYTLHGLPQPWLEPSFVDKVKYTIERLLLPITASEASAVVAVSNYVKSALKFTYSIDSEVIYNAIEADGFTLTSKRRSRKELGYDETDLILLFVGRLHPYKDPLTLIKGFNKARKRNRSLHLVIIGSGHLYSQVAYSIGKLRLSSHARLLRHVSEEALRMYYTASNIFVLPSVNEAFGIVLLEAMASGLPIIASNSGACSEIIGKAGIMFDSGNHFELAEKIVELSSNKELLRKTRKECLKRVRRFSWRETAENYCRLYERFCAERRTSRASKC